ncbi:conserved hypothetical protein [Uncinocarpus reesii 1704]|uniref:Uncharacterized protein n=1 Tax=Uncinocarpus reesii (strain UAMH 1704) TaxID=336963 RepID=C4JEQ4_UNCRE|nr:uncharacterized protein UREG_02214 [Uncinocarpus reesii 1704]EEP77365.1 conserved hypothetical protein [Uncinocarpus reesii 1704]
MDRPAPDYAQSGLNSEPPNLAEQDSEQSAADQTPAAAAVASPQYNTSQPENRAPAQYTAPAESRTAGNLSTSNTPQPDYTLNQTAQPPPPPAARPPPYPDYLARQPQYHHAPNTQAGGAAGMAQATSPSMNLQDGPQNDHRNPTQIKSDTDVPIDPSIAAASPTYPPPYSPYQPQGHDMAQYQGHPPPQMYARPDWPHQYGQHQGLPGPYSSPATTVGTASPVTTAGPRPGQVYSFVPIPGSQQHKRPRRRYEEIERMYKFSWRKANSRRSLPQLMTSSLASIDERLIHSFSIPPEFKEIRKEWKARKKEEENQRKAAEERERAAAQGADSNAPPDPNNVTAAQQPPQPAPYPAGVRPQLPPIGYQPADGQVPNQYGNSTGSGLVYPSGNGQIPATYPTNYPHSPYGQGSQVYQQPPPPPRPDGQFSSYQ